MTEQRYDPKAFALELGFSEEDAELFGGVRADATNLRRIARRRYEKGVMADPKAKPPSKAARAKKDSETSKAKAVAEAKAQAEREKAEAEAKARADDEAEAADRPTFEGQDKPPSEE